MALHNNEALFETFGDTTLTTATATNGAGAFNPDRDGDGEPDGLECGGCGGLYGQFTTVARLLKMGREVLGRRETPSIRNEAPGTRTIRWTRTSLVKSRTSTRASRRWWPS